MEAGVRDHIPLEQGLRQHRRVCLGREVQVRDHIPLEQGLRPMYNDMADAKAHGSETIFH